MLFCHDLLYTARGVDANLSRLSATESCRLAVHVKLQKFRVRQLIVPVIALSHEGISPRRS
jgi:hypothetical protein